VQAGGNLVVVDVPQISGNTAIAGVGGSSTNSNDPGYIAAGDGAAMGDDIFVREQGTIVFDVSGTLTIATPIEGDHTSGPGGSGGLQKIGAGTLNLGGANTYSGTTTVDGGTLNLNGSVIGDVAIGAGGTLSGNATVAGGLNTSGAVLASIDSGGNSKVAVSGAASLAGTLDVALAPAVTSGTYTYEVLTASGITGTFDSVAFTGATPGQYAVSYLPEGAPTSVQIQLSMTGAVLLSSNSVGFGNVAVGDSDSRSVTLTNGGAAPLTITSIDTAAPFSSTNNCGAVLAVGASCAINLSFSPTAAGGAGGTLTVLSDAPTGPDQVSLSGTGTQPAVMLSSNSVSFGRVVIGDSDSRSVTLTNSGAAPLTITSIDTAAPFSSTNDCGAVLAANASCTINLSFSPTAAGSARGALTVVSDAPTSPDQVSLSGNRRHGGAMGGDVLVVLALAAVLRRRFAAQPMAGRH
jgi:autotransporter-associated beta strand protein